MNRLNNLTIIEAHQGLIKKEFSARELALACLDRIKKRNKDINAFLSVDNQSCLKQAEAADKKIAQGETKNFLTGIPIAIKDNILIDGFNCTAGSKILQNYQATYDATVIEKLKESNAVFLGKTNLDEFAMGGSTENSAFGPTKNPRNLKYVAGGSSGGSAAAVADEMCLGALGSDTGGSIRQPAAFCGVIGLKPTYGRVSRYGLMAMASSLDQVGPIAKTVDDAAILLKAIEGKDEKDSTSVDLKNETELPNGLDLKKITIGLPKEYFIKGLDKKIKNIIDGVVEKLEKNGAKIKQVSLPHSFYALACYYIIMPAEASTNLSRYDGIKYGLSKRDGKTLSDIYFDSRSQGFGEEVQRRIILGTYVLSAGYYDEYYLKAQKVRTLIKQDFKQVFKKEKIDFLLTPTTPTTAWQINEKINDPLSMYLADIYTVSVNLAGLPAVSLPVGKINDLPVGLQIIGNYFEENKILQLAKSIEQF
jgi:aspartyl-tRNA(Asn)/glutamyl-tRNA(Gln) amidotransferase subunit A